MGVDSKHLLKSFFATQKNRASAVPLQNSYIINNKNVNSVYPSQYHPLHATHTDKESHINSKNRYITSHTSCTSDTKHLMKCLGFSQSETCTIFVNASYSQMLYTRHISQNESKL